MIDEALYEDEPQTLAQDAYAEDEHGYDDHDEELNAEDLADSLPTDPDFSSDTPSAYSDAPPLDPLDQLPMALTLRCGQLQLTLGDLRRIAAGSVLEVSGIAPGHATLCHGERVVAEGELVDVDGRLGLQITRVASHP
ncbi:FliM/FliN family flagellar motor switch protein [Pseudomonas sp. NPDC090202]|uniref:FliM/FliN family flagellar motor switch protein n=1 Tax=unclassified Pseudomonas TaxID=196821 RepID=UPI0037FEFFC3